MTRVSLCSRTSRRSSSSSWAEWVNSALALNRRTETPLSLVPGQIGSAQIGGKPFADPHLVKAFVAAEIVAFKLLDSSESSDRERYLAITCSRSIGSFLQTMPSSIYLVLISVCFVSFQCYKRGEIVLWRGIVPRGTGRRSCPIPCKSPLFPCPPDKESAESARSRSANSFKPLSMASRISRISASGRTPASGIGVSGSIVGSRRIRRRYSRITFRQTPFRKAPNSSVLRIIWRCSARKKRTSVSCTRSSTSAQLWPTW